MKQTYWFSFGLVLLAWCLTACQPPEITQPTVTPLVLTPAVSPITPTAISTNIAPTPTLQPSLTPKTSTPVPVEVTPIILFSGLPCPSETAICDTEVFRDNKPIIYTILPDGSELKNINNSLFTFKDIPDLRRFTVFHGQSWVSYFDIKADRWYINNITDESGLITYTPATNLVNYGVVFDVTPDCLLFYSKYPENNKIYIEKGCSTDETVEQLPTFSTPPSIKLIDPEVNLAPGGKHILLYGLDNKNHFYSFLIDTQKPDDEPTLIYQENQPVQAIFQWMSDQQFNYLIASPTQTERVNQFFSYNVLDKELIDKPIEIILPITPNKHSSFRLVKWLSNTEIIFAPESELPGTISGLYFLDIQQNQTTFLLPNYLLNDIVVIPAKSSDNLISAELPLDTLDLTFPTVRVIVDGVDCIGWSSCSDATTWEPRKLYLTWSEGSQRIPLEETDLFPDDFWQTTIQASFNSAKGLIGSYNPQLESWTIHSSADWSLSHLVPGTTKIFETVPSFGADPNCLLFFQNNFEKPQIGELTIQIDQGCIGESTLQEPIFITIPPEIRYQTISVSLLQNSNWLTIIAREGEFIQLYAVDITKPELFVPILDTAEGCQQGEATESYLNGWVWLEEIQKWQILHTLNCNNQKQHILYWYDFGTNQLEKRQEITNFPEMIEARLWINQGQQLLYGLDEELSPEESGLYLFDLQTEESQLLFNEYVVGRIILWP